MLYPSDEMMMQPHNDHDDEDMEFLEFEQELEQESRLHRGMDASLLDPPLACISLSDNSSSNGNENHDMDVGIDLNLDEESSSSSLNKNHDDSISDKHDGALKKVATTPKTAATTKVDDSSTRKSRRRRGIPKDISVKDTMEDETTAHQLFLLDQQIVLEQFGVYSDLSEEEEEEKLCCLQDIAAVTLEASVNASARLVRDCQGGNEKSSDDGTQHGHSKVCSSLPTDYCGQDGQEAYQHCYEGLRLFVVDDEGGRDVSRSTEEPSTTLKDQTDDNENSNEDNVDVNRDPDKLEESYDDDEAGEFEAMIGGNQYAVNRSFSSHTQSATFCQGNCDVMSQYWERIKLALSNRNGDNFYQAIDAKSQASVFSFFDNTHQQLENTDSLSYSSVGDDGTFKSPFFPVLEKCHNGDESFSNEMDKMISCALPNGLVFCTIWLDHPDYWDTTTACDLAIDESDFYIRNGCEVVWKISSDARNGQRFVEFPHHRRTAQASDLLRCFAWAGDKDHAVVYQLNMVLAEMRRAMEKNGPQETKKSSGKQHKGNAIQDESTVVLDDSAEIEASEIEVVLWSSPKRIFPHFVDVHGNQVSKVHLVREKKATLVSYSCASAKTEMTSFGRIVFFVKTIDSIPSLLSAPSDEMAETEQGEETVLEESVVDDEEDVEEEQQPHDEHQNEEWSAAERSNVTTMIDNRTRPQRVRYILEGDTDEEFSEKFGL
ncbi:unnamed protein product [Cylindrotheca closterium]|uniref:Uncharacterized protein n=1 Tax=Cylindrotheca closterium TaxID=2856 RepID=A0AAD2CR09_9STRA|nr:unnamed protein product [Cylindrotheca closterium]